MNNKWVKVSEIPPPENLIVDTKLDDQYGDRLHQKLKRKGRLFFFEDDSIYVYYTPTHWKYIAPKK